MKKTATLICLVFATVVYGQTAKKTVHFNLIKTILTDINDDGKIDTITISSSLKEKDCFNRISISLAGFKKQTFRAKYYWSAVDKLFLDSNKNAANTKLLFLKKTDKHAVILLFSELDGAGYRGEFSMINIENNNIKMVFDHSDDGIDVEVPKKLADLENNGRLCFIYCGIGEFESYSAKYNADIGSYQPRFVYPVSDTCKLDKVLMKKYNEDHYVFAGYDYNDKVRILYPRNGGKPRIWKK